MTTPTNHDAPNDIWISPRWGLQETNNVSFTHWTGYEHVPCGADTIRTWLDRSLSDEVGREKDLEG